MLMGFYLLGAVMQHILNQKSNVITKNYTYQLCYVSSHHRNDVYQRLFHSVDFLFFMEVKPRHNCKRPVSLHQQTLAVWLL